MVDHEDINLTLRTRLNTLSVCTTGSATLGVAESSGEWTYTRSSGSFITDGFKAGLEVVATGFGEGGNNVTATVKQVEALVLTMDATLVTEAEDSGRTLAVGLPEGKAWENTKFDPSLGSPYIEEQYIPGPSSRLTLGVDGWMELTPMYAVAVYVPDDVGIGAGNAYADAILNLFPPGQAMTLTNGDTLRVRADTAAFRGQLLERKPGWGTVPVTIPLRLYTTSN